VDLIGAELPSLTTLVPGVVSAALAETLAQVECPALTARRARGAEATGASHDPIAWHAALGANVQDADGNVFVDLTGGFGAALLGHSHPEVVDAVREQSGRLLHALGDVHPSDTKIHLLNRVTALAPWPARTILGLSGADAVEAALKTAVLYTGKPGVLAFTGGYHGLSHGPLAMCGYSDGFRDPFAEQLNTNVRFAHFPHGDMSVKAALSSAADALYSLGKRAGCVIVDPIQGRGGVRVPPKGFLKGLSRLCKQRGLLLIVDEIYTGLGRTGEIWHHEADGAEADLICAGKSLGGGLPISACIGKESVMAAWASTAPGGGEAIHTSTFAGNPLSAAAALAVLERLEDGDLRTDVKAAGKRLKRALAPIVLAHGGEVRGEGLLLGYAPNDPSHTLRLVRGLLERGYITLPAGAPPNVLCLTPPLCLSDTQIDGFVEAINGVLSVLR